MADAKASILIEIQNNAKKGLEDFNKQFASTIAPMQHLGRLAAAAVVGIGAAITGAAVVSVSEAAKFQQTSIAFATMLGNGEQAQAFLAQLANFAAATPFEIPEIEQNAKQLLAMGFSVQEVIPTLKSLGDVSAGLSVPLSQIALAYGQVRTANQLYGSELRQFVQAGVPIIAELANQFNVTEAQIKKMTEQGKVSFKDVEKAFQSMSGEGGKFFNLMDSQSKTFLGQWSNFKDNITISARDIGKGMIDPLTNAMTKINDKLKEWRTKYSADLGSMLTTSLEFGLKAGKAIFDGLSVVWEIVSPKLEDTWKLFKKGLDLVSSAISSATALWTQTLNMFHLDNATVWEAIKTAIEVVWAVIIGIVTVAFESMQSVFAIGTDLMKGNWSSAWNESQNILINAWNAILTTVATGVNAVIHYMNFVIDAGNNLGASMTRLADVNFAGLTLATKESGLQMQKNMEEQGKYQDAFRRTGTATSGATETAKKLNNTLGGGGGEKGTKKTVDEVAKALVELGEKFRSFQETGTASILKLFNDSNQKLAGLRQQYKDLGKEIVDAQNAFNTETKGANKDMASQIVEQEQKVSDIKKEIAEKNKQYEKDVFDAKNDLTKADSIDERNAAQRKLDELRQSHSTELAELTIQLTAEETALRSSADVRIALTAEVTEARRRAGLTEFGRILEDYKNEQALRTKQFEEDKNRLIAKQKTITDQIEFERKAYLALQDNITLNIAKATADYKTFITDQKNHTKLEVDEMIKKYEQLAKAIQSVQLSSSSSSSGSSKSTPVKKFATGVSNFEGGTAIVGERGPELVNLPRGSDVIPNNQLKGQTINLYISGNTIMDKNDVIDKIGDPMIQILKQHFAVV